jgi:antitoxin MazE
VAFRAESEHRQSACCCLVKRKICIAVERPLNRGLVRCKCLAHYKVTGRETVPERSGGVNRAGIGTTEVLGSERRIRTADAFICPFPRVSHDSPRLTGRISSYNIVITMKAMHVSIRKIGNSQGVVIPKPVLTQLGLSAEAGAEMTIEGGALVLRRPASPVRTGWAEAARRIAKAGDDALVMGEFGNAADAELTW